MKAKARQPGTPRQARDATAPAHLAPAPASRPARLPASAATAVSPAVPQSARGGGGPPQHRLPLHQPRRRQPRRRSPAIAAAEESPARAWAGRAARAVRHRTTPRVGWPAAVSGEAAQGHRPWGSRRSASPCRPPPARRSWVAHRLLPARQSGRARRRPQDVSPPPPPPARERSDRRQPPSRRRGPDAQPRH
jgi:hypothetical protein